MNHKRNLSNYAESLVLSHGKFDGAVYNLNLNDLPDYEQGELAAYFLESIDRDTSECVYGDDFTINNDYTCALLLLLKQDTEQNRERLAQVLRKNIVKYFHGSLQEVIDEACNEYLHAEMHENHMRALQYPDNGEIYWSQY